MGTLSTDEVGDALNNGQLRRQDLHRLVADSHKKLTPFESEFKVLKLDDALKVMQVATPNEKATLEPLLRQKIHELKDYPRDKQELLLKQLDEVQK